MRSWKGARGKGQKKKELREKGPGNDYEMSRRKYKPGGLKRGPNGQRAGRISLKGERMLERMSEG